MMVAKMVTGGKAIAVITCMMMMMRMGLVVIYVAPLNNLLLWYLQWEEKRTFGVIKYNELLQIVMKNCNFSSLNM